MGDSVRAFTSITRETAPMRADRLPRWTFAALGVLLLWACLSVLTERVSLHSLSGVATSAAFLTIGSPWPTATTPSPCSCCRSAGT